MAPTITLRACAAAVLALFASAGGAGPAGAVPNDSDGDPVVPGRCQPQTFALTGSIEVVGLPLARSTVELNAASAKFAAVGAQDGCDRVYARIPRLRWTVVSAPRGQRARLSDADTLTPELRLAGPGSYRVRLTACPGGCAVTAPGHGRVQVRESTRDVDIRAVASITLPPETRPAVPRLPRTEPTDFSRRDPDAEEQCLGGGGVVDPQWTLVEPFSGPADYEFVEGRIDRSRISSMDNFLNHESQDHIIAIAPDPPYRRLLSSEPEFSDRSLLGVEWEIDHFPRVFRPTVGDRASIFGFWILDCGHSFYTEIHPPVGIASQRPRPVRIPSTFQPQGFPNGLGSNVIVPGVATDVYFSRRAGEITSNCSDTGLHQPPVPEDDPFLAGECVRDPHPLGRVFRFRIYLPRSPHARLREELGREPPPVPLYAASRPPREGASGGGPEPVIRVVEQDGFAYLDVELDLRGFEGDVYARRIEAAWAFPSPENWDARRWRVHLDALEVEDDAEPAFDDGDWRMFFNTNNTHREWTKIMDCNGCVDDNETIRLDFSTGRELGDDPIVFPDQQIVVHTTGYDDELVGDSTGQVLELVSQELARSRCVRNRCRHTSPSRGGGGAYDLEYTIRRGPSLGSARLTPEGRGLLEAYRLTGEQPCSEIRRGTCVVAPERQTVLAEDWHPDNMPVGRRGLSGRDVPAFEPQESERFALTGIPTSRLRALLARLRARLPERYRAFLAETRAEIRALPRRQRADVYPLANALRRSLSRSGYRQAFPPGYRPSRLRRFRLSEPSERAEDERRERRRRR